MLAWLHTNETLLWWLGALSALTFAGSLLAVPWLAVRIPADYFLHRHPVFNAHDAAHPLLKGLVVALKNIAGVAFLLLGIAMLVLPGQGILTILIGLILLDFPGKFALERRIIEIKSIHRGIDWMRKKAHRPPLILPKESKKQ
ncbi:MAG: hypothetical protein IT426_07100 [Pirellulales bacterium]|nr:hypothetical protein [Pirellulales bacterium]